MYYNHTKNIPDLKMDHSNIIVNNLIQPVQKYVWVMGDFLFQR